MGDDTLEFLLNTLARAKAEEAEAKSVRIRAEEEVLEHLLKTDDLPEDGSKTVAAGALKCTVKRGFTVKADVDAIRDLDMESLPLKRVPTHYVFDKKAYEDLRKSDPAAFAKVAAHVVTKPSKPSLTIKL